MELVRNHFYRITSHQVLCIRETKSHRLAGNLCSIVYKKLWKLLLTIQQRGLGCGETQRRVFFIKNRLTDTPEYAMES